MSNDIITTDLQSQQINSGLVELYELELSESVTLYFYGGLDSDGDNVRFHPIGETSKNTVSLSNEYIPLPVVMAGIETQSDGASNRPTVTFANVGSMFRAILQNDNFTFDDIVGKKLIRRRTFEKYLVGGEEAANPFEFPYAAYIIDRIAGETNLAVEFELAAPFDVNGIKLPNRVIVGKYCSWIYQGADAGKPGGCFWKLNSKATSGTSTYDAFFDADDNPLVQNTVLDPVISAYSSGTTYAKSAFVSYGGKYWRSEISSNQGNIPTETSLYWKLVHRWRTYSSSTTYAAGDYVKYDNKIWKSLLSSNSNNTPEIGSVYWIRVDYCSKTLNGCKCRFQFVPTAQGLPSADKDTSQPLPFGAFPGSVKFK